MLVRSTRRKYPMADPKAAAVTATTVAEACESLFRSGQPVTGSGVRELLGQRGSVPAIYRYIKEWEAEHLRRFLMMEALVDLNSDHAKALDLLYKGAFAAASRVTASARKP
ncbi:hypothetical protein EGJ89_10395 [Stenotrophomonas maltophilia]|nr:hypothetical protein EGJ89_10395 [Stenotrophomonas maltophilia]